MLPQIIPVIAKPEPLLLLFFISIIATALKTIATIATTILKILMTTIVTSDVIPQIIHAIAKLLVALYCC